MTEEDDASDVRCETVPRFEPNAPEAVEYLREHGFVVIQSVLNPDETEEAMGLLWNYLEGLGTGIDRSVPDTWGDDRWPPTILDTGILAFLGIGQTECMWFVRTRPRVAQAFAALWAALAGDTSAVLTSFDGCCVWRPWDAPPKAGWYHCDQNAVLRPEFQCLQGLVNLIDTSEQTGGNLVVDRSHSSFFPQLAERFRSEIDATGGADYFVIPRAAVPELRQDQLVARLHKGDLLVWDSRTVHCSAPNTQPFPSASTLKRAVAYVSMVPSSLVPDHVLHARHAAITHGHTTTHWVTKVTPTHLYQTWVDLPDAHKQRFTLNNVVPPDVLDNRPEVRNLALGPHFSL